MPKLFIWLFKYYDLNIGQGRLNHVNVYEMEFKIRRLRVHTWTN